MRSLQLVLRDHWDFEDESVIVRWTPSNESDLLWWSDLYNILTGVSLEPLQPDLLFWSDASDRGWGVNLLDRFVLGSLVSGGAQVLHQPRRTLNHLSQAAPLSAFRGGLVSGKCHSPVLHQETRRDVFVGFEQRGSTPPPLGRFDGHFSGAPVHHGGEECRGFPESTSDSGIRVDPGSGGGRRVTSEVACYGRPLHHFSELPSTSVPLPSERPHGGGDRCVPAELGRSSGFRLPTVCPHLSSIEQAPLVQWDLAGAPYWPQELTSLLVTPPVIRPSRADLLRQPHFEEQEWLPLVT